MAIGPKNNLEAFDSIFLKSGITSSEVAVISGVFITTLTLSEYLNIGVWTLISIVPFVLIFIFHEAIPSKIFHGGLVGLSIYIIAGLLIYGYVFYSGDPKLDFWGNITKWNKEVRSGVLSFYFFLPVAIILAAYQKEKAIKAEELEFYGGDFPEPIKQSLRNNLTDIAFYKKHNNYEITFVKIIESSVIVNTKLKYCVVNRRGQKMPFLAQLLYSGKDAKIIKVSISGIPEDKSFKNEKGYIRNVDIESNANLEVGLEGEETFNVRDNEIYTSYQPSSIFNLEILDKTKSLDITVDKITTNDLEDEYEEESGIRKIKIKGGVLPHQGVRINWKLKNSGG